MNIAEIKRFINTGTASLNKLLGVSSDTGRNTLHGKITDIFTALDSVPENAVYVPDETNILFQYPKAQIFTEENPDKIVDGSSKWDILRGIKIAPNFLPVYDGLVNVKIAVDFSSDNSSNKNIRKDMAYYVFDSYTLLSANLYNLKDTFNESNIKSTGNILGGSTVTDGAQSFYSNYIKTVIMPSIYKNINMPLFPDDEVVNSTSLTQLSKGYFGDIAKQIFGSSAQINLEQEFLLPVHAGFPIVFLGYFNVVTDGSNVYNYTANCSYTIYGKEVS